MAETEPDRARRTWSVFDREGRLVAELGEGPGELRFLGPDAAEPLPLPHASVRCLGSAAESDIVRLAVRAPTVEALAGDLEALGYRVVDGPPRTGTFARL